MRPPVHYEERFQKRIINLQSKFILIGNAIDGYLDFQFYEFGNFDEVKSKLLEILQKISCAGEWDISLYQVDQSYKIKRKYGYYQVPDRGKLIYNYSYMSNPVQQITFAKDMIIFCHTSMSYPADQLAEGADYQNYNLDISILKIKIQ